MSALCLAFMGTPDFALPSLEALAAGGHDICAVYSQPPRPAGRGQQPRPGPVAALAQKNGWPLRTPTSFKDPAEQDAFAALDLDLAVVVAYGLLLPKAILDAPRLGCVNLHASLLPRWRGAAPISRALLAGDKETGVTLMQMEEGLDSGPILAHRRFPIPPGCNAIQLHDALARLGAELLIEWLPALAEGRLAGRPQPSKGVTYARKLERGEARLDWRRRAEELERQVRAFSPWPGAHFASAKGGIKVLAAEVVSKSGSPGELLDDRLTIACGKGALRLTRVQRAGRSAMSAQEFLRGFALPPGTRLPLPEAQPAGQTP
ncbi:MAG: methionyl-tRNA formyltransferase [Kiloniellales bacterium]